MANAKTTKKTSPKTETEKAVVKENLTTEKAADSVDKKDLTTENKVESAPQTETVIENNGLEQTVKETPPKTETENKGVDFDAKSYIITNPAKANKKVLGSRGQLIEFDSEGSAKVDVIEAQRYQKIPGYTVKES